MVETQKNIMIVWILCNNITTAMQTVFCQVKSLRQHRIQRYDRKYDHGPKKSCFGSRKATTRTNRK